MAESKPNRFVPDYATHPGEILEETLMARGMKKSEFAERCRLSTKTISLIISGKAHVTPETAIQFERVLGVSANIWNNLDANYRLHVAKVADLQKLESKKEWANKFPVKELVKKGYLPDTKSPTEKVKYLYSFFGVANVEAWKAKYKNIPVSCRKSSAFNSSFEAIAAWLRIGELEADKIKTDRYDRDKFKKSLLEIRPLTSETPEIFEPKMKELCRKSGVALVFVSELPKTRLSGATRWLRPDKALIMLSLRYKVDDHFWFTFFHEAGHILLHGKKRVFIDEKNRREDEEERQADQFAAREMIPDREYQKLTSQKSYSKQAILAFAESINIAPSIVVGRLQHEEAIPHSWLNGLKRKLQLVEAREKNKR